MKEVRPKRFPVEKWDGKNTKIFKTMFPNASLGVISETLDIRIGGFFKISVAKYSWVTVSDKGYPLILTKKEFEKHAVTPPSGRCYVYSLEIQERLAILDSEMKELQYAAAAEEIPAVQIPFVHWTGASSKKLEKLQSMFPEFTISHYLGNLSFKDSNDFVKDYGKSVILTCAPNGYPFELTQGECNYYANYDEFDFIYDYDIETIIKVRIKRLQNLL